MARRWIYQFYAELSDFEPLIWRRFQTPGNITLARLAYIVMTLYEMRASHLFAVEWVFDFRGEQKIHRYELPCDDPYYDDEPYEDVSAVKLGRITNEPGMRFNVNYDFGDDWNVAMKLEKIFEDDDLPGGQLPRVLEGAGFGIVEDCGGAYGLKELAEAFKKKRGEAYKEFREWLGVESFDIDAFDLDDMNFRLKKIPRIYKQLYEEKLYPTKQSIALIEREYLHKGKRAK